jgi:hypothetical protein
MARNLVTSFATGLALSGTTASAQTDGWGPIHDTATLGPGKAACWSEAENSACLLLTCRDGGPLEVGLLALGGGFGFEPVLPVYIRVDGGTAHELLMSPLDFSDYQHAAVTYDPDRHSELLRQLRTGRWASIALHDPEANPLPYPLGNRPDAVDAALAACGAAQLSTVQADSLAMTPTDR